MAQPETLLNDLMGRLASDPAKKQLLPDFVFVRDPGYMILRVREDFTPPNLGGDFSTFAVARTGPETLPLFFVTLNTCLGLVRLRSPNFNALWVQLIAECQNAGH